MLARRTASRGTGPRAAPPPPMASPRTIAKIEARIHERAAYCLQFELADPRSGMITLTGVKLSPDLSIARIRYTVLGGPAERSKAEHMLASAAGFIQRQVGRVLDMRRTPTLHFHYDEGLEEARRVEDLIAQALERDKRIHQEGFAPEDAGSTLEITGQRIGKARGTPGHAPSRGDDAALPGEAGSGPGGREYDHDLDAHTGDGGEAGDDTGGDGGGD